MVDESQAPIGHCKQEHRLGEGDEARRGCESEGGSGGVQSRNKLLTAFGILRCWSHKEQGPRQGCWMSSAQSRALSKEESRSSSKGRSNIEHCRFFQGGSGCQDHRGGGS